MSGRPPFFDDLAGVAGGTLSAIAGLTVAKQVSARSISRLSAGLRHFWSVGLVTAFFVVALAYPLLFSGSVAGDAVDSRFNMFILEHTYRWLTGQSASLASPRMFYPYPYTLFFSDTHFGSSFVYIVFRFLGLSEYRAFNFWFLTGALLTLWSGYFVLARWRFNPLAAGLGAAMFALSLPSVAQMGHPQLIYRFCIPLAVYETQRMLGRRDPFAGIAAIFWLAWQALINIYLGGFLFLLMLFFAGSQMLLDRIRPIPLARDLVARLVRGGGGHIGGRIALVSATAFAICTAGAMLAGHLYVSRLYDISRAWDEVSLMVPRPIGYLIADELPYWVNLHLTDSANVPMRWEQCLFIGMGALILLLIGAVAVWRRGADCAVNGVARAGLLALVGLIILVTQIDGWTLYRILFDVPGVDALRAVARIGLVLAFPAAVIGAAGFESLRKRETPLAHVLALLLGGLFLWEAYTARLTTYDGRADESRVEAIVTAARAKSAGVEMPILHVLSPPGQSEFVSNIDAMLATQRLGWPTVDGYSGFIVGGEVSGYLVCTTPLEQYISYVYWIAARPGRGTIAQGGRLPADLLKRTVVVGSRGCPTDINVLQQEIRVGAEQPLATSDAAEFELHDLGLEETGGEVVGRVEIRNGSDHYASAGSPNFVSLSWRFVRQGEPERGEWRPRHQLPTDIPPGGVQRNVVDAMAPAQPGVYHLQVTLVSEMRFWFHDQGMKILTFSQPIEVK
jgi:hypothetical protein